MLLTIAKTIAKCSEKVIIRKEMILKILQNWTTATIRSSHISIELGARMRQRFDITLKHWAFRSCDCSDLSRKCLRFQKTQNPVGNTAKMQQEYRVLALSSAYPKTLDYAKPFDQKFREVSEGRLNSQIQLIY